MAAVASSRRAVGYAALAAAPALIGCEFETAGLETLLDPDPSFLNTPGKRLAEGRFSKLEIAGNDMSSGAVLAFRDEQLLSITPFSGGGSCDAGPAGKYGLGLPGRTSPAQAFVPFLEAPNEAGFGLLRFADLSCALSPVNLPDSELPLRQFFTVDSEPREFAMNFSAELHALDPWRGSQSRIATSVSRVALGRDRIWTVENGVLTLRDAKLIELRRFGTTVSELVVDEFGNQAAYIDAQGVHLITAPEGEPILLDSDACELSDRIFGRYEAWQWLSYLAPCSSRRLVSVAIESRERFEFGENSSSPALIFPDGTATPNGHGFFVTEAVTLELKGPAAEAWLSDDDLVQVGTLWGGRLREPPARGPERAVLQTMSYPWQDKLRVVVDFDGAKGRLVEWNLADGSINELAQGVAYATGSEVLANFDGTVGDLFTIDFDLNIELLAERVPAPSAYGPKLTRAVIADFDGTTGSLLLFDDSLDRSGEVIARGVPLNGFNFMWKSAILYQDEFDPVSSTGRLVARFIPTADTFPVQAGVSEFHETSWPEQGVLYSVTEGNNSGIWFARAR